MTFRARALATTFVSEPDPRMFGNSSNPNPSPANWSPLSKNWLRSRFHFSFAEWSRGPGNFGVLRVMNDDLVQPQRMFGPHPHRDMEIATYIVEGALTHWHIAHGHSDEAKECLGRGSLQFMTAGTGITHSEGNDGDVPLRFIQMWITPRSRGIRPNYGSVDGSSRAARRTNQWDHLLTDIGSTAAGAGDVPAKVNQDCNIFVAEMDQPMHFTVPAGRQVYVLNMEGPVTVVPGTEAATVLPQYESGTALGPLELRFAPAEGGSGKAHVLLVEMEAGANRGL